MRFSQFILNIGGQIVTIELIDEVVGFDTVFGATSTVNISDA